MAGRAQGYSDYYKNNDNTPGGSYDDEEDGQKSNSMQLSITMGPMSSKDRKKAAIRRRMMKNKNKMGS